MVKKNLVEALLTDGARLLHELDRQAFPVEAMFWVHLDAEDYWRLVITSNILSSLGGPKAYQKLNGIPKQIELAGITLEDISLFDPAEHQAKSLLGIANISSKLAAGQEWLEFEDAIVYRWNNRSIQAEISCGVALQDLHRFWEAERKVTNLPGLLISLEGRTVTLRYHPQHGPHNEIEQVKQPFALALHKPEARPDCKIHWLR